MAAPLSFFLFGLLVKDRLFVGFLGTHLGVKRDEKTLGVMRLDASRK
ncbi:hypothetical protein [Acanthopleuribacter pedis]|nr:hypothetical protein [Acanthopleuribacter pedis]